jgi:chromosome segregation ATPase
MIPDIAIELLNTLGLGILGVGLVTLYRALIARSDLLKQGVTDLQSAHTAVISAMERRAKEVDQRFEDEKHFRDFYLSMLEEVDAVRSKVRAWKEDEIGGMHAKIREMTERLDELEELSRKLRLENQRLEFSVASLQGKCRLLEAQNKKLEVQLGFAQPGVRGIA